MLALAFVFWNGATWAGVFRKDQDIHSIKGFGAIEIVDGRPMIGKRDACICVPLGTQFRLNAGPYFTYDPEGKTAAICAIPETNLKAEWHFVVQRIGEIPD